MGEKRVYSLGGNTGVYHFYDCAHARKILVKNKVFATFREVKDLGMSPCKCCNSPSFHFKRDADDVEYFCRRHGLEIYFDGKEVYVSTKVGFWKLHYSKFKQKYCVFHGNGRNYDFSLEQMQRKRYHRQADHPLETELIYALKYIQRHDKFKLDLEESRKNPQKEIKVADKYQASYRRRQENYSRWRINKLFRQIEAQNPEMKQLSIC